MTDHLDLETLARWVDSPPDGPDAPHLEGCLTCAGELEALRAQSRRLAHLPPLPLPGRGWTDLEARLMQEGLIRPLGALEVDKRGGRGSGTRMPPWLRAAAGILLFLAGTGAGALVVGAGSVPGIPFGPEGSRGGVARMVSQEQAVPGGEQAGTLEEAALALQLSEARYLSALGRYRELLAEAGGEPASGDPAVRYAALERIVAASQAAVREAPTDPFLNGILLSAVAERQAALRLSPSAGRGGVTSGTRTGDGWF